MKLVSLLLIILFLSSCSKDCQWEYDACCDQWVYRCYKPTPVYTPADFKLVNGTYYAENFSYEIMPMFKGMNDYQDRIDRDFKYLIPEVSDIYIEKTGNETARVSGLPSIGSTNAKLTANSISFSGESGVRLPNNYMIHGCMNGITYSGSIRLSNGKPNHVSVQFQCPNDVIMSYEFNLR